MRNLFNYDSPVMQALSFVGDLIIVNVVFLVCCVPLFTIGAAQSGLYNAVRVLQDKEDDSSPVAAFFRGFKNGFGRITIVWVGFALIFAVLFYNFVVVYLFGSFREDAPTVMAFVGLGICCLLQAIITVFHSRFSCTVMQLLRNAVLIFLAHPLRTLLMAILHWSPLLLVLLDLYNLVLLAPVFIAVWFSVTFLFGYTLMKKPFRLLESVFLQKQSAAAEKAASDMEASAVTEDAPENSLEEVCVD